jgi:hypothetical protein
MNSSARRPDSEPRRLGAASKSGSGGGSGSAQDGGFSGSVKFIVIVPRRAKAQPTLGRL